MNIYPDSNPVIKSYLKIREVDGGSDMVGGRDERGQHHVDKVKEQC
jgi:hypothetical protein